MARVWIYDLNNTNRFREALGKAKKAGRKPPARWQVTWYDNGYNLKSEAAPTKTQAEGRRSEIERTLMAGTYIDPAAGRVRFAEMADKWLDARHDLHPSSWWPAVMRPTTALVTASSRARADHVADLRRPRFTHYAMRTLPDHRVDTPLVIARRWWAPRRGGDGARVRGRRLPVTRAAPGQAGRRFRRLLVR